MRSFTADSPYIHTQEWLKEERNGGTNHPDISLPWISLETKTGQMIILQRILAVAFWIVWLFRVILVRPTMKKLQSSNFEESNSGTSVSASLRDKMLLILTALQR